LRKKEEKNLKIRDARTHSDSVCDLKAKCSEASQAEIEKYYIFINEKVTD
jgi:hypothetical protein